MKTILVPTDFSANAANAIAYAVELVTQLKGKLILCHALQAHALALPEEGGSINPAVILKKGYLEELEKISKTLRLENGFRFDVESICESKPLGALITKVAEARKVDLIVMGTRGANNFLDKLLGTNTQGIMEIATCPVLAIPAKATFTGFKKLVYASDFEKEESLFLNQLFTLANPFQAEVHIVNIKAGDPLDLVPDEQVLAEVAQKFGNKPVRVSQVKASKVVEGIRAFIQENEVDVVAVAISKRGYLDALLNRSVSAELAFESTLPLLALPAKHSPLVAPPAILKKDYQPVA